MDTRTVHRRPRKGLPPHGTRARYNSRDRCRCNACTDANADYGRDYRARPPATRPVQLSLIDGMEYAL